MNKPLRIGVVVLVCLATVAVLAVAVIATMSDRPGRQLRAMLGGADAIAWSEPRRETPLQPGPAQPRVSPAEAGIEVAALEAAVNYAGARNTRALLVGRGGHIVFEKYWGDTTADTAVDASGFTPVLAALMTGVALNERAVRSLDAPLSSLVPEWEKDARGAVTLRQLLVGESGFEAVEGRPWPRTRAAKYHVGGGLRRTLIEWPLATPRTPGTDAMDVDADLLALALGDAFELPYDALLTQYVWQPLGAGPVSMGTDGFDRQLAHVRAGCCLRARIADWMRVGELLANDGVFEGNQFAPPRFVTQIVTPVHKESKRGFFTHVGGDFAAHDIAWLEAGGKQRLWVVPSLKLVILRVGDEPAAAQGWDEKMIPDTIVRGTSGWRPAAGEGVDPNQFAPH